MYKRFIISKNIDDYTTKYSVIFICLLAKYLNISHLVSIYLKLNFHLVTG